MDTRQIKRELKNATWTYDEATQELTIEVKTLVDGVHVGYSNVTLNRTYAFSLARFLIRIFFRMSMKHRKLKVVDQEESLDEMSESLSETSHSNDTL